MQWFLEGIGCASPRQQAVEVNASKPARALTPDDAFQQAEELYSEWKPAVLLSNNERLYLRALYLQATRGDVMGDQPPLYRPSARAQWMAWAQLEGDLTQSQAKAKYVQEVQWVIVKHGTRKG